MEGNEPKQDEPDHLTFKKDGDVVQIWAMVDGETVFHATPDVKRSTPVSKAAMRTFARRAWPEIAEQMDNAEPENGGAFR